MKLVYRQRASRRYWKVLTLLQFGNHWTFLNAAICCSCAPRRLIRSALQPELGSRLCRSTCCAMVWTRCSKASRIEKSYLRCKTGKVSDKTMPKSKLKVKIGQGVSVGRRGTCLHVIIGERYRQIKACMLVQLWCPFNFVQLEYDYLRMVPTFRKTTLRVGHTRGLVLVPYASSRVLLRAQGIAPLASLTSSYAMRHPLPPTHSRLTLNQFASIIAAPTPSTSPSPNLLRRSDS